MAKKLSYIVNSFLLLAAIYLLLSLNKIAWPLFSQIKADHDQEAITADFIKDNIDVEVEEMDLPDFTPASRARYALIADKDLFRPQREEWYPPPPPEEEGEDLTLSTAIYGKHGNLKELPKPVLSGVVIIGNKKYAIMQGHYREEVKVSSKANTRSRRTPRRTRKPRYKIQEDTPKPYHIGDMISEYQIIDILENKVILDKNGEQEEILLREQLKQAELNDIDEQNNKRGIQFPQGAPPPGYNTQIPYPSVSGPNPFGRYPQQGGIPQSTMQGQRLPSQIPRAQRNVSFPQQNRMVYPPQGQQTQSYPRAYPQRAGSVPGFSPQRPLQAPFLPPGQRGPLPMGTYPPQRFTQ